eukprot:CAMPEP_0171965082 /NCGR_PEP_ID=MMETSP0993-20121228/185247_1 /TAXON_ID=483369 /ORGANISM="non described non described, Strain CCMP2098" /LENGTH=38 /DNA_ID= /DNA_START= /DNA_END= /DNA_ORIENTATION=
MSGYTHTAAATSTPGKRASPMTFQLSAPCLVLTGHRVQ